MLTSVEGEQRNRITTAAVQFTDELQFSSAARIHFRPNSASSFDSVLADDKQTDIRTHDDTHIDIAES